MKIFLLLLFCLYHVCAEHFDSEEAMTDMLNLMDHLDSEIDSDYDDELHADSRVERSSMKKRRKVFCNTRRICKKIANGTIKNCNQFGKDYKYSSAFPRVGKKMAARWCRVCKTEC